MHGSNQQCIMLKKYNLGRAIAGSVGFDSAEVSDVFISVSFISPLSLSSSDLAAWGDSCANPSRNISGWVPDRASTGELIPLSVAGGVTQSQPPTH